MVSPGFRRPNSGLTIGVILFLLAATAPAAMASGVGSSSPASFGLIDTIPLNVSGGTWTLGLNPVNGDLYLGVSPAFSANGSVEVTSTSTDTLIGSVSTPTNPGAVAIDLANGDAYVPNLSGGYENITVISGVTNTAVRSVPVGPSPTSVADDPANGNLYVGIEGGVAVLSGTSSSVVAAITTGSAVTDIVYAPTSADMYALDGNNVTVLSSANNSVLRTIALPGSPGSTLLYPMLFDPANGDLYVGVSVGQTGGGASSSVISTLTNSLLTTIPNTGEPVAVGENGDIYAFEPGAPANVSVISATTNALTTTFGIGPALNLLYDSANGGLVGAPTNPEGSAVSLVAASTGQVESSVTLPNGGGDVYPILYDPASGLVYVVSGFPNLAVYVLGPTAPPAASPSWTVAFLEGVALGGGVVAVAAAGVLLHYRRRRRSSPKEQGTPGM